MSWNERMVKIMRLGSDNVIIYKNKYQRLALEVMHARKVLTLPELAELSGVSIVTADKYVSEMLDIGVVQVHSNGSIEWIGGILR